MDETFLKNKLIEAQKRLAKYPYSRNFLSKSFDDCETIYRVEKFDDFKSNFSLTADALHFSHPGFWEKEDPLDSIFLKKELLFPDGTPVRQGYYDVTFCQCWSKTLTQSLWETRGRDHAPDYCNIAMVSSVISLMMSFEWPKVHSDKFWCVEVEYLDFCDSNGPIALQDNAAVAAWCNAEAVPWVDIQGDDCFYCSKCKCACKPKEAAK